MNNYLSDKIKVISFISILFVVVLHAYNFDTKHNGNIITFSKSGFWFFENYFSNGVTRVAVPFFFVFSGFLYFLNFDNSFNQILVKYKKRIKTLLVPFLFWSLLGILFYFTLQSIPFTKTFFTKELVVDYSFLKWITTILIEPIPYQLWFIRDLMVLVLLSPILFLLIKNLKLVLLIFFGLLWIYNFSYLKNSIEALFFFTCGGYLATHQFVLNIKISKIKTILITLLWLLILTIVIGLKYFEIYIWLEHILYKLSILIGLLAVWSMYDLIHQKHESFINKILVLSSTTFFIYASHEPTLSIFKKILFILLGKEEIHYFQVYFIAPLLTIIVCLTTALIFKKIFFKFYSIITGNR